MNGIVRALLAAAAAASVFFIAAAAMAEEDRWDDPILESHCRVDARGVMGVVASDVSSENRKAPFMWLFIPRNATPGEHTIKAVQPFTKVESNAITVRVLPFPTPRELASRFDEILALYRRAIPRNTQSGSGR